MQTPDDPIHTPLRLGGQTVPGLWRFLLPDALLRSDFPEERRATCNACPMVAAEGFRPDYRCCTYHPRIPGFLLGLALHREVSGKAVRDLVTRGLVLPEGTERTPASWEASLRQTAAGDYGKGGEVLCPILDPGTGFCRLHAYRNATCSTYFCLYDFGARSSRFWESIQEYVTGAETALAQWSLAEVGFDLDAYFQRLDELAATVQSVSRPGGGWSEAALDHIWGDWRGREIELLRLCAEAVSDARADLIEIAARTVIRRPVAFEAAEVANLPEDLAEHVDPSDLGGGDEGVFAPVPLDDLAALAIEAMTGLWELPLPGTRLRLHPEAGVDGAVLRFKAQEGEGIWELPVDEQQASALRHFASPRPFSPELLNEPPLSALENPARFLAEWLGYGVLEEV